MGFLKNKKAIWAAVLILLVAAGLFAAAGLFRREDARAFYFKAESNQFKRYSQWLGNSYSSWQESQRPYKIMPYKRRMELTADVASGGKPFGMENADRLYDLVKRSKLVVDTQRQPLDDTGVSNITLLLERVPFIDTTAYTKDGKLYFAIPVLMPEKYFSVDISKIDEVYDRFSIPVRPKRLVNETDAAQTVNFDKESFNKSAARLGSIFSGQIGEDDVRFGDTKELIISGQSVTGREVLVSLDASAATELIGELFRTAASDDALLAYTYGNFADLSALLDDAGLFRLSEYLDQTGTIVLNENEKKLAGMLNVKKNAEAFRSSLKTVFDNFTVKSGIEMTVVIDKAGNILDRRLTLNLASKDGNAAIKADIHTGSSNTVFEDCRNRFVKITLAQTDHSVQADTVSNNTITELSIIPAFEKTSGTELKGRITLGFAVTPRNGDKSSADIELDISGVTDTQTLKRNDVVRFKMNMYSGGLKPDGNLEGELSRISWNNKKLNARSHTMRLSVNADLPTFGIERLSAVVSIAGEDRLGIEQVLMPEVQQDRITDLNSASDAELDRIRREALASFGTFYLANKPVFDAILGK